MQREEIVKTASFLLEKIGKKGKSASEVVNKYTNSHRYISGEDRKELLNLVWGAIRARAKLDYLFPNADWAEKLACLLDGLPEIPDVPNTVKWEIQEWMMGHIPEPEIELPALMGVAPIVLRAVGNRDEVMGLLRAEGLSVHAAIQSPFGIILEQYANLSDTKTYKKGLVEIQDEGAQLVSLDIGVEPHDDVFDFCAGAGGKSLIFAQLMENKGFIQAYDAYPARLSELVKRARRANISIIKTVCRLPEPYKKFDHVVVDAPCSGSGTWRRSPDLRWNTSEKSLQNVVKTQAEILETAAEYVKNGHCLTYITCSIFTDENEAQIERFLSKNPRFVVLREKRYSPARTGTDGFYVCVMQKR